MNRLVSIGLLTLLLLLVACTGTPPSMGDPPAPSTEIPLPPTLTPGEGDAIPTPTTPAEAAPSETPAPTPQPAAGLLPAPLFYLRGEDMNTLQIWRMEPDGQTSAPLTNEPNGIREFDVSPADGSLVYVSGRELVRVDAMGNGRTVLFTQPEASGPPNPLVPPPLLSSPRWSPDGSRIAFGLAGVNVLDVASGSVEQLLANHDVPEAPTHTADIHFYLPDVWSPDGSKLVVLISYFPEGGETALYDFEGRGLVRFQFPGGLNCCTAAWSPDSSAFWLASEGGGYVLPGLVRVNVETERVEVLFSGDGFESFPALMTTYPMAAPDGFLYAWTQVPPENPDPTMLLGQPLTLSRAPLEQAGEVGAWATLSPEQLRPVESHLAPGQSGAVIAAMDERGWNEGGNPLLWVPTDGSPMQPLEAIGRNLRWGR